MTKPVSERAGFKMPATSIQVWGRDAYDKEVLVGLYDEVRRIFQHGGNLRNLVFEPKNVISYGPEVWTRITERFPADIIEAVDHEKNQSLRCPRERALKNVVEYSIMGGTKRRFGIPLACFDLHDAAGTLRTAGREEIVEKRLDTSRLGALTFSKKADNLEVNQH